MENEVLLLGGLRKEFDVERKSEDSEEGCLPCLLFTLLRSTLSTLPYYGVP